METRKLILYLVAAVLGVALWNTWQRDFPSKHANVEAAERSSERAIASEGGQAGVRSDGSFVPETFHAGGAGNAKQKTMVMPGAFSGARPASLITVKTDVLLVKINLLGGDVVQANLLKYPVSLKEKTTPVRLFRFDSAKRYVAQSGLTNTGSKEPVRYHASQTAYQLAPDESVLTVRLVGRTPNGLRVEKRYTFRRDRYAISSAIRVSNAGSQAWHGSVYYQFERRNVGDPNDAKSRAYYGPAISSPSKPYEKISFKDLSEEPLSRRIRGGWLAMQQHYFLGAWVPKLKREAHYYSHERGDGEDGEGNLFTVGFAQSQPELLPGKTLESKASLYVGPEIASRLKPLGHGLDLTIDYGWLAPISMLLFWVMHQLHRLLGNWGWSIVGVTLLIKMVFYWFSKKSFESMARMREAQPRLEALKARYGHDKQAHSKASMEFYKKEKLNPLGGCLPMIIQIPVFFALYYVLIESVSLRQAPFIFWIHDLSVKDPFFVLPVLMGASMFFQQKLSPTPPDPTQAKMMMLLPVIFTVFFLTFPSGLVLYWLTNNCASMLQQWWVMKTYDPKQVHRGKRKNKK